MTVLFLILLITIHSMALDCDSSGFVGNELTACTVCENSVDPVFDLFASSTTGGENIGVVFHNL